MRPRIKIKKGLQGSSDFRVVMARKGCLERNHQHFDSSQYSTVELDKSDPNVILHIYTEVCICGKWVKLIDYRERITSLIEGIYKMR
jgi:hypothetical protein